MTRQVALLRGINIGPNKRIAMAELREHLTASGYGDVETYLQSGNVLLESTTEPAQLAHELELRIAEWFSIDVPVVVRTREELAGVVARDPLGAVIDDPKRYQVSFLSSELDSVAATRIAAAALPSERVVIAGREIYAWHPAGINRSALALALADRRLGVVSTARNWNTVTALLGLAQREHPPG
jgi:uncharacterized protein (DUF1697 family)